MERLFPESPGPGASTGSIRDIRMEKDEEETVARNELERKVQIKSKMGEERLWKMYSKC